MAKVQIWGFKCERCGHEWAPRGSEQAPTVCPKCKSPYWDRPRRGEISPEERIKPKALLAHQLNNKSVEFELQRGNKPLTGIGSFSAVEGADGFMKVSIWVQTSATERF